MKKFFLFSLLTLMCSVMAWGETRTAGTYAELQDAIAASAAGDVIELTADIAYPASPTRTDLINIDKSITLDGKGHAITGYGYCNYRLDDKETYQATHLAINAKHDKSGLNVTIKNLKLNKDANKTALNGEGAKAVSGFKADVRYFGLGVFDGVTSLTLEKDTFTATVGGNVQTICVQGSSATPLQLTINNSYLNAMQGSGYPTYFLKPVNLEINDSKIEGFCGLYFKPNLEPFGAGNKPRDLWYGIDNYGSKGSVVVANNTQFIAQNPHNTKTNSFGIMAMEEGGIDITLNNCGMDAEALKSQGQALFLLSDWAPLANRKTNNVLTITGDNSHINGDLVHSVWYALVVDDGEADLYENGYNDVLKGKACEPFSAFDGDIQVIITGGTYNFDPRTYQYDMHVSTEDPHYADGAAAPTVFTKKGITIPAGYTVQESVVDDVTLYRVIQEIQTSYDINANVPEEAGGAGENPNTNFIVQETTTLDNNETEANYILVQEDNGNAATLTVGKVENPGTAQEAKVDQTLTVTNGIDVQDDAQVIVKSGSALVVENGGVITAKPENIVIEANEEGAASLLLSPAVAVNQTPNLTVRMTAKQIGRDNEGNYGWHRFAMPVAHIETWEKEGSLVGTTYPTYLYGWDYINNDWVNIAPNEMDPLRGYTLTLASEYIDGAGADGKLNVQQDVTYIFKGKLVGNTNQKLEFSREGFNYFGNSYTGYMFVLTLLEEIGTAEVEGTAYMWDGENQKYEAVSLYKLKNQAGKLEKWQKEVAPMQTFILRLRGADSADEEINYASAIWGNPRYGNNVPAGAPRRRLAAAAQEESYLEVVVKGQNGKSSKVDFTQMSGKSDEFESGFDAVKYMNKNFINLYAAVDGENLSSVVTDNLEGKKLNLQTTEDMYYTMSFKNVEGEAYAVRDNATGAIIAIEEGASYEFAAQPNSTVEGRFEIVDRANVVTSIDNAQDNKADVKGIYTIMGQYVGENFDVLPTGVYVVDGVKIVK